MKYTKKNLIIIFEGLLVVLFFGLTIINYRHSEKNLNTCREYNDIVRDMCSNYDTLLQDYEKVVEEKESLEIKLLEVELPTYDFTEAEIYLLAQCVEAEAGYDSLSQKYITQVILNRLHSGKFPDRIEKVIYQKENGVPQFSVAYNGMMEREVTPQTLSNVYEVIVNGTDLPEYVLYFYSDSITDNWVNTLNTYEIIDGTVFAYQSKEGY